MIERVEFTNMYMIHDDNKTEEDLNEFFQQCLPYLKFFVNTRKQETNKKSLKSLDFPVISRTFRWWSIGDSNP